MRMRSVSATDWSFSGRTRGSAANFSSILNDKVASLEDYLGTRKKRFNMDDIFGETPVSKLKHFWCSRLQEAIHRKMDKEINKTSIRFGWIKPLVRLRSDGSMIEWSAEIRRLSPKFSKSGWSFQESSWRKTFWLPCQSLLYCRSAVLGGADGRWFQSHLFLMDSFGIRLSMFITEMQVPFLISRKCQLEAKKIQPSGRGHVDFSQLTWHCQVGKAYLTFVASGQISCKEDGGHHRPCAAANAAKAVTEALWDISKAGAAGCFFFGETESLVIALHWSVDSGFSVG